MHSLAITGLQMDKTRARTWVYHKTEQPKIVYEEDAQIWYDQGWEDSPAKFLDIDKMADDLTPGEPEEAKVEARLALKNTIDGIDAALEGELNLEIMTKGQLVQYGNQHLGLRLSFGQTKKKMIERIRAKIKV